jgi:hypothetical protein
MSYDIHLTDGDTHVWFTCEAKIAPGARPTWYPNSRAHDGAPPEVDIYDVKVEEIDGPDVDVDDFIDEHYGDVSDQVIEQEAERFRERGVPYDEEIARPDPGPEQYES